MPPQPSCYTGCAPRSATARSTKPAKQRRALRFIAITFFALAAYVTVEGIRDLATDSRPNTSIIGIVLTAASIVIMPWLARAKRKAGQALNSRLVLADAAETKLCAWLSVSTFAGLVSYAALGWTWIDPVAGFHHRRLRPHGRQGSLGRRTRLRRR